MNKKLKLGILLFLIGSIALFLSLTLFTTVILPLFTGTQKVLSNFPEVWYLIKDNFIIYIFVLLISVIVGTLLYDKVNLKMPIFEGLIDRNKKANIKGVFPYGIIGGTIIGVVIAVIMVSFIQVFESSALPLRAGSGANFIQRFFRSGIAMEIITRFGLMTFLVWLISKTYRKLSASVYWSAIIIMVILSGLGGLLISMAVINEPMEKTLLLMLIYNLLLSVTSATVYGWLYWKKGLETAIIAHITGIVIVTVIGYIFNF